MITQSILGMGTDYLQYNYNVLMVTFLHVNKPMYDMLKLSRWHCVCY